MPDNLVNINDSISSENIYFDFLPQATPLLNFSAVKKNNTVARVEHNDVRFDGSSIPFQMQSQSWISILMLIQFFVYFYALTGELDLTGTIDGNTLTTKSEGYGIYGRETHYMEFIKQ